MGRDTAVPATLLMRMALPAVCNAADHFYVHGVAPDRHRHDRGSSQGLPRGLRRACLASLREAFSALARCTAPAAPACLPYVMP